LNLFFILMLLLIAIGTILRVPTYGDKKMVFNVILAALLINFSKPIALLFIDISQLAMGFFMGALSFNGSQTFADQILATIQIHTTLAPSNYGADGKGYLTPIFLSLVAIIFFLVMAVMLFVLAATLLVRVVAFWVLIILSPMAMFGLAMPRTGLGSLQRDWFQKMFHWSFLARFSCFFFGWRFWLW